MAFEDELREVQAEREISCELEAERLEREGELLIEAGLSLASAAATLQNAKVVTISARTAHKDRGNWKWPTGRDRVEGWWMRCGDVGVFLRIDGWLAVAHKCNDSRQTPCACPFARATSAVPPGIYLPVTSEAGKSAPELMVRTTVDGEVQDLVFNRWLAEQVADLLSVDS